MDRRHFVAAWEMGDGRHKISTTGAWYLHIIRAGLYSNTETDVSFGRIYGCDPPKTSHLSLHKALAIKAAYLP